MSGVRPISEANQPGWEVPTRDGAEFMLWAPRPARDFGRSYRGEPMISPARTQWSACWQAADGEDGDFRKADTPAEALACFPGTERGKRARRLLMIAAVEHQQGVPVGNTGQQPKEGS